ncbi:hypothetical protein AB0I22_12300 [Streptomyces sp. NPDC050610]|uniref:hypothetical protein n=1 Tax=Streptomyces sp. NPDC050610 TaxID=3157097 RepID=UPI00341520DD
MAMSRWRIKGSVAKLTKRLNWASLALIGVLAFTVGCSAVHEKSGNLGYEPQVRDGRKVEQEIGSLSSEVLEAFHVKGKVTEPGPAAGRCDVDGEDAEKYRNVRHPWSLHGLGNDVLGKGMDNLVERLPGKGWKIVERGHDSSRNKNQRILAVHLKTHTQAEVTWMKGLDGHEPLIEVAVYSRCFRDSRD